MTDPADISYKVVEVAPVGEDSLERVLNERSRDGWSFESVHFVTREGSHRPSMAYVFFTRSAGAAHAEPVEGGAGRGARRGASGG